MSYTVEVTREEGAWIADVTDVPGAHTYARNLVTLDGAVREVIELVEDLPDGADIDLKYVYSGVDETFLAAANLGEQRVATEAARRRVADESADLAHRLSRAGYSVRDIGQVLGITAGRVSQIVKGAA